MRILSWSLHGMGLLALGLFACAHAQSSKISPASAYASSNLQPASRAIDNNPATRWESNHGASPGHLTLDLGQPHTLSQIRIDWEAANASDYTVLGSNDNASWSQIAQRSGGAFGNRTDTLALSGNHRYVRINALQRSAGNHWGYSIWEASVFGSLPSSGCDCRQGCVTALNASTLRATVSQGDIVDIHYRINNGAQQNLRMNNSGGLWSFDITGLAASTPVSISHTIISNGVGQTTPWKNYTLSSLSSSCSVTPPPPPPVTGLVPLFDANTQLEPAGRVQQGNRLITRFADRARDRHAKENQFQAYDHYLSFYWEHRTAAIEIIEEQFADNTASIRMNVRTQWRLNDTEAENRWFYRGIGTVAEFCDNGTMVVVDTFNYYKQRTYNCRTGQPIRRGDKLEFEISQFLDPSVPRGRAPYYGTTYLYIVGEGIVPWDVLPGTFSTPMFSGGTKDSVKIPEKAWLGGRTTLPYMHSGEPDNHFLQMATNLNYHNGQPFVLGRRIHHSSFVSGAHDEHPENGVFNEVAGRAGPRYINERCTDCHVRNGRAAPEAPGVPLSKWVFKVGDSQGNPHPNLGRVLQPRGANGVAGEGTVAIAGWSESNGLRSPSYQFSAGTPARFSARIAPQLVGIGLLEAVPESVVLALEDPNDANGDGISGRANRVTDPVSGVTRLGRFGWKAATSSVRHQVASALNTDMGVTTSVLPNPDCGSAQTGCGPSGIELSDTHLDNLVKYIALLGVRPQRDISNPAVQRGETTFANIGCAGCHRPSLQTSAHHPLAELRDQTIHPYTDLLLHDMGPGLADTLGEGQASGSEWRTTPLWGLGLSACVTGGTTQAPQGSQVCTPVHSYLHDGRARSIEEAILWHGGEGQASNNAYRALSASQKQDLLRFLESL